MRFVIFGLTVSSSWGNGHATLWRGLIRALIALGHEVIFFERDVSYYADHRDLKALGPGGELVLYREWDAAASAARAQVERADVAIVTSYCPDGVSASKLVQEHAAGLALFYDLDTPVTLARLSAGERPAYLPPEGLGGFDLVLSYTGGAALEALINRLGARVVAPLYGHVDPNLHRPVPVQEPFRGDLSYLGTYAEDRQAALERLFIEPARRAPDQRFVLGGAGYPADFPWQDNMYFVKHLPPGDHPGFFSSSPWTLNVTRTDMAAMGWCPSGRLFEAAACGAALISDAWEGLDAFFEPGKEIITAREPQDVLNALALPEAEVRRIAARARERVLAEHSSAARARELMTLLDSIAPAPVVAEVA